MRGTTIKTKQENILVVEKEVVLGGTTWFMCTTPDQYKTCKNLYITMVCVNEIEFWNYMEN